MPQPDDNKKNDDVKKILNALTSNKLDKKTKPAGAGKALKNTDGKRGSNNNNLAKTVKKKKRTRRFKVFCVTLAVVFLAVVIFVGWYTEREYGWITRLLSDRGSYAGAIDGELAVHFVDVGQGDAIIIELPDGKNMIIDGGDGKSGRKTALHTYIEYLEIEKFDYLMLTHSDEDHVGGLVSVVEKYEISTFYVPEVSTTQVSTAVYKNFVKAMDAQVANGAEKIYSSTGCSIIGEYYKIYFITPRPADYPSSFSTAAKKNSISPIIILEFGSFKIMFTGDATANESEKWFIDIVDGGSWGDVSFFDVDVLKVAHHGGKDSTCAAFLGIVQAEYFVICVGKGNTYKHPETVLLTRLEQSMNANPKTDKGIFRTDENGDVLLKVNDKGDMNWKTAKAA